MFAWLRRFLSRQTSFEIQGWTAITRELSKTGRYGESKYMTNARQKAKDEMKPKMKLYRLKDSA